MHCLDRDGIEREFIVPNSLESLEHDEVSVARPDTRATGVRDAITREGMYLIIGFVLLLYDTRRIRTARRIP